MRIDKVVVNASPLICLFKSGLQSLLPELFAEIIIPAAVWEEILKGGYEDSTSALVSSHWAQKKDIDSVNPLVANWDLGKGESEVLTFASENPDYRAMVDDKLARNCAKSLGIKTLGTGGMLILAKKRGILNSVTNALEKLQSSGLWLSSELLQLIRKQAGE